MLESWGCRTVESATQWLCIVLSVPVCECLAWLGFYSQLTSRQPKEPPHTLWSFEPDTHPHWDICSEFQPLLSRLRSTLQTSRLALPLSLQRLSSTLQTSRLALSRILLCYSVLHHACINGRRSTTDSRYSGSQISQE